MWSSEAMGDSSSRSRDFFVGILRSVARKMYMCIRICIRICVVVSVLRALGLCSGSGKGEPPFSFLYFSLFLFLVHTRSHARCVGAFLRWWGRWRGVEWAQRNTGRDPYSWVPRKQAWEGGGGGACHDSKLEREKWKWRGRSTSNRSMGFVWIARMFVADGLDCLD